MVKVENNLRDVDGKSIGTYQDNTQYNTELYEVKYQNSEIAHFETNIIAKNIFAQVDSEGYHFQLVDDIQDHYSDLYEITQEKVFIKTKGGHLLPNNTTSGWELLVEFKDGSSIWINVKDPNQ